MSLTGLTSPSTPITAWFGYSATNANSGLKYSIRYRDRKNLFGASEDVAGNIGYYDGDGQSLLLTLMLLKY